MRKGWTISLVPCPFGGTALGMSTKKARTSFGELKPVWVQYSISVAAVAVAVGVRMLLDPILGDEIPYTMLYPAVAFAAYFGGLGPATFAVILGTLAADFFFLPPRFAIGVSEPPQMIEVGVHVGACLILAILGSTLRQAGVEAESQSYEAELAHLRLNRTLESITDCVYILDCDWRFTKLNRQAAKYFGRSQESLLGAVFWTAFPVLRGSIVERNFFRAMQQNTPSSFETLSLITGKWVEIAAYPSPDGLWVYVKDVSERKRTEQALKASEERFRHMADACPAMIWVADVAKDCTWVNRAWLNFAGRPLEQELGRGWVENVQREDREPVWTAFSEAFEGRREFNVEYRVIRHDGECRWVLNHGIPWHQAGQEFAGYIGSCIDITESKRHRDELEHEVAERTARLQETIADLEAFSYTVAHDMRAPLRSMQNFSAFIANECEDKLGPNGKDYLQRIITSAKRMDQLILDVLSYSRVARGHVPITRVDLGILLRGIVDSYPVFQAPSASISVEEHLPAVLGNEALLTQCLANLLGNAVKFVAPHVHPRVTVRAECEGGTVRLWIEDNGIGIPHHMQGRIFGMFERLTKNYEGTGIGLAIVRKSVERMGGEVGVLSESGAGSRFWLRLQTADSDKTNHRPVLQLEAQQTQ